MSIIEDSYWATTRPRFRLKIKRLSDKYIEELIEKQVAPEAWPTAAVTNCIENYETLFNLIDQTGIAHAIPPRVIMQELYRICIKHNPKLER